ncbi:hypothetical protein R5R35_005183 [Gryllus longicercus]|uniref:Uncharacterized protein n=1 Tax=Gryllus longicercus TaxID=2509291 RepID=A0AAN9W1P8_9ORTH
MSGDKIFENVVESSSEEITEAFANCKTTQKKQGNDKKLKERKEAEEIEVSKDISKPDNIKVYHKKVLHKDKIDFFVEAPIHLKVPVSIPVKEIRAKQTENIEDLQEIPETSNNNKLCDDAILEEGEIDVLVECVVNLKMPLTVDVAVPVKVFQSKDSDITPENTTDMFRESENIKVTDVKVINLHK